jgi:serine/threonine protein kinase
LKIALRYVDASSDQQAPYSYELYNLAHWLALQHEDEVAGKVDSPHVLKTWGAGVVSCPGGEELPGLLLELGPGGCLKQHVVGVQSEGRGVRYGLRPDQTQHLMRGIGKGIAALHASGIFHQDLKSSNILLGGTPDHPVPKIADFGTCRDIADLATESSPLTRSFGAPEQQAGMFQDLRLDTFLMALTFCEMRFGNLPFGYYGNTPTTLHLPPLDPSQYIEELMNPDSYYNQDDEATGTTKLTEQEVEFLQQCLEVHVGRRPHVAWLMQNSEYLRESSASPAPPGPVLSCAGPDFAATVCAPVAAPFEAPGTTVEEVPSRSQAAAAAQDRYAPAAELSPPAACLLSFAVPAGGVKAEHPVRNGSLLLLSVQNSHRTMLCMHLLRVKCFLGMGANSTVWMVGWSREHSHLLEDQQQPWVGIRSSCKDAAVAALQHEQQEQAVEQQFDDPPLTQDSDDFALKVALRYADASSDQQASCPYEVFILTHWLALQHEHEVAGKVDSPHVLKTWGAGVVSCPGGGELPGLLLELAPGGCLKQHVMGVNLPGGGVRYGLQPEQGQHLMQGIAQGIAALHASGIFHGSLMCSNILLGGSPDHPVPKIADFGTCRDIADLATESSPLTRSFGAPEQQAGMFQDLRLDTFLMGSTFFEMRFGMLPFGYYGNTPTTLHLPPLDPSQYIEELMNPDSYYNQDDRATGTTKLTEQEVKFLQQCLEVHVERRPHVAWLVQNSEYLRKP